MEDQNGQDAVTATYTYGNYIDEPITLTAGGNTYYYHTNNLYNVRALTDENGAVVERYRYSAYGSVTILDPNDQEIPESTVGNVYMFQGRRYDLETGMYYYRNRMMSSELGRFLQRDPLGYVDGWNLYEFVDGNPMLHGDPSGLQSIVWTDAGFLRVPSLKNERCETRKFPRVDRSSGALSTYEWTCCRSAWTVLSTRFERGDIQTRYELRNAYWHHEYNRHHLVCTYIRLKRRPRYKIVRKQAPYLCRLKKVDTDCYLEDENDTPTFHRGFLIDEETVSEEWETLREDYGNYSPRSFTGRPWPGEFDDPAGECPDRPSRFRRGRPPPPRGPW